jgi:hypothetical protein
MTDCVGTKHLTDPSSPTYQYQSDRNGLANDAFGFNGDHAIFPDDTYFNSAFTVTLWTKATSCISGSWCRLFDFGGGAGVNNVYLALIGANGGLSVGLFDGSGNLKASLWTTYVLATTWSFVAVAYDGYTITINVNNGAYTESSTPLSTYWVPASVTRPSSFLGKSNWADGFSNSIVDQMAIYNRYLTSAQITQIYTYYSTYTPSGIN